MPVVLLTGSSGGVGRATQPVLAARGWTVRPFDSVDGCDLRDEAAVRAAMRGCDAVVHAGALAHDSAGPPSDIVATNVLGTWHVLSAAESAGVARVVYFSSAQVFGCAEGEGSPFTFRSTTTTRFGRGGPTGCRSAWPKRCATPGAVAPAFPVSCCGLC